MLQITGKVVAIVALICVVTFWIVSTIPLSNVVIAATSVDSRFRAELAMFRLRFLSKCPEEQLSPNAPIAYVTGAHNMAGQSNVRVLLLTEMLLKKGCDVDMQGELGFSALHMAVITRDLDLIEFLIDNGADPNSQIGGPEYDQNGRFRDVRGESSFDLAQGMADRDIRGVSRTDILRELEATSNGI